MSSATRNNNVDDDDSHVGNTDKEEEEEVTTTSQNLPMAILTTTLFAKLETRICNSKFDDSRLFTDDSYEKRPSTDNTVHSGHVECFGK